MFVVGVIGQKGGGGKTTTSLGLAVAAAEKGRTPVIIDLDQQANSAKWRDRRQSDNVAVIGALQSRIRQTLETARAHGADYVVIDCPGHNDSAAMETVRAADMVLLPVEAQMFHFETLPAMHDLVRVAGNKPTWVFINKLHPAASVQGEKLKRILADTYGMAVCPVHWSRLDVYGTSADVGLTPLEAAPQGKAAEEIRQLYNFTCQQLNKLRNPHVKNELAGAGA
ncbi:MAG TPA: AAA family ATPase [Phycisphaerae bacterium]|jgi:chromosome partitioning protein|nr:AAA family ATPase [Phycisphaerae bacterium]